MRDLYSDDYHPVADDGAGGLVPGRVRRIAGAAVFLGLILVMGLWAYRLGTRDATEVPIIRAMEGPARVLPEDPGGEQAPHQGLEVNSVLAGDPAPPPTDAAPVAPPPAVLAEEDLPQQELPEPEVTEALPMTVAEGSIRVEEGPFSTAETLTLQEDAAFELDADAQTLEPVVVEEDEAVPGIEDEVLAAVLAANAAAEEADADPAATPGPRPMERPAELARSRAAVGAAPAVQVARADAAPEPTAALATSDETAGVGRGSRLVQLGAFDSEAITRNAWAQLQRQHGDLLGGKSLYVERTTANARVFYRLRVAGFDDTDQTRAMCEALRARGVDCIPVTLQ